MPSADSSVENVPSNGRRQSAHANGVTPYQTQTRHDFQTRSSAKHLTRLEKAIEEGDYGIGLSVRHCDQITLGMSVTDCEYHKDSLPRPCCN
jgi:hypothetical protein